MLANLVLLQRLAMSVTRISTKGQVVLPKEVREALQWETGQELEVISLPDGVMLKRAGCGVASWADVLGRLQAARSAGPATDADIRSAVRQRASERFLRSKGK